MALTVEDGTGLPAADAFVSVAAFKAYCDLLGIDYSLYGDTEIEQAIRRATYHLSRSFNWQGYRVNGRAQALAWPRYGVCDYSDPEVPRDVPSTEVPQEIIDACCEIAVRELATPGAMNPDVTLANRAIRERVEDAIEIEYANPTAGPETSRPILMVVDGLVAPFLAQGSGSAIAGRTVRV